MAGGRGQNVGSGQAGRQAYTLGSCVCSMANGACSCCSSHAAYAGRAEHIDSTSSPPALLVSPAATLSATYSMSAALHLPGTMM